MEKYISPKEVANLLGVTPRTVYSWIANNDLPALKIGNTLRVREADLDRLMTYRSAAR